MNLIEQNVQNITQTDFSYVGIMKFVERVGRICTNSNHRITEDSWRDFVEKLRKNKHYSVFGHATMHLKVEKNSEVMNILLNEYRQPNGTEMRMLCQFNRYDPQYAYWSISMRVFVEHITDTEIQKKILGCLDKKPNYFYAKRPSLWISTAIATTRELNRHGWNLDIMEQSTRYVIVGDVSKKARWDTYSDEVQIEFTKAYEDGFKHYNNLLDLKVDRQDARGVLPLDTATEVIYTAFDYQWEDVIAKRTTSGVHPDCRQLVEMARKELK